MTPRMTWNEIEHIVRAMPARHNLVVSKVSTPEPPPFTTSRLGRRRGALRQFRDDRASNSLHIKEYADRWIVHTDDWNPRHHVMRHLAVDRGYTRFIHLRHWVEHGSNAVHMAVPFAAVMAE